MGGYFRENCQVMPSFKKKWHFNRDLKKLRGNHMNNMEITWEKKHSRKKFKHKCILESLRISVLLENIPFSAMMMLYVVVLNCADSKKKIIFSNLKISLSHELKTYVLFSLKFNRLNIPIFANI